MHVFINYYTKSGLRVNRASEFFKKYSVIQQVAQLWQRNSRQATSTCICVLERCADLDLTVIYSDPLFQKCSGIVRVFQKSCTFTYIATCLFIYSNYSSTRDNN